ncbi:MAG TPA: hypothetical protein VMM16_13265 [Verrucomicrobiae bacterium]|nr:hypothetical protein [Verrucomicrobiae bacterium]
MGKINWGRVLLGGLVAGVVINVVEYVLNTKVLASENAALMTKLGVQMHANAIPIFVVLGFVLGIATVWAYAVARPRYGAGAKTAVIVALGIWVIGYVIPDVDLWAGGILPKRLLCIGAVVGLVEIIVASVVGAALYKEA